MENKPPKQINEQEIVAILGNIAKILERIMSDLNDIKKKIPSKRIIRRK